MDAAARFVRPPTAALRRLAAFLQESGSQLDPTEVAAQAINEWIATAKGQYTSARPTPTRGYQWKSLFLPEGTELRMSHEGTSCHAHVMGNAIVYEGRSLSPRQFTMAVAGQGRNAWRDLWIRLPGESRWKPATLLRREAACAPPPKTVSPMEAMSAAAACMSETLRNALALVEHANAQVIDAPERRAGLRRIRDALESDCRFD